MASGKLTDKQAKFVNEYLIDLNATQAAIRAGYSERTAKTIAAQNLSKPNVAEAIKKRQDKLQAKTEITQERVLAEYAKIAFLDTSALFDGEGNLKSIHDLPKEVSAAIGGLDVQFLKSLGETGEGATLGVKKIKLIDKKGALDSLARHLGMFEKDNAQRGDITLRVVYDEFKESDAND